MRLAIALAAATIFTISGAARADTINVFSLTAATQYGSAAGTVTLDSTLGKFTDSNIGFLYGGSTYTFSGAPTSTAAGSNNVSAAFAGTGSAALFDFDLLLPVNSLVGYNGGSICSTTRTCSSQITAVQLLSTGINYSGASSGTLTLLSTSAVTPEPSGLLLLGTGVLTLGVLLRKRYV